MRPIILRTQTDLVTEIGVFMRDTGHARWSAVEKLQAINDVLMGWSNSVLFPAHYTITNGFTGGEITYQLPAYVSRYMRVQMLVRTNMMSALIDTSSEDGDTVWRDANYWSVTPDNYLQLDFLPAERSARIEWWHPNPGVDTTGTLPTVSTTIDADDLSLIVAGMNDDVGDAGWIKIENEFIRYAGMTRSGTTATLTLTERGAYNSTAAGHNSTTSIEWCVAFDDRALIRAMRSGVRYFLHGLFLTDASNQERVIHEKMVLLYRDEYEKLMRHYSSAYRTTLVLRSKGGIGI